MLFDEEGEEEIDIPIETDYHDILAFLEQYEQEAQDGAGV